MKRKLLAILLTLTMTLSLLPTAAFASGAVEVGNESELKSAITAADGETTIQLTADVTLMSALSIPTGKEINLDLNGYTITCSEVSSSDYDFIGAINVAGGTLTIEDNSANDSGKVLGGQMAVVVRDGYLTVNGGTFGAADASSDDWNEPLFVGGGSCVINDGTFLDGTVEYYYYYSGAAEGSLIVNGGRFDALPLFIVPNKGTLIWAPDADGYVVAYKTYADFAAANSDAFSYDSTANELKMTGAYAMAATAANPLPGFFLNGDVTLDLNGQEWTMSNSNLIVINGDVTVTLKDSVGSGIIENKTQAVIETLGTLNIEGGKLKSSNWPIIMDGNSTVNMTDGELEGLSAIVSANPSGGTAGTKRVVNISGGKVTANWSTGLFNGQWPTGSSKVITGGTFNLNVASYCPEGYTAVANGDGTYTVQKPASYVAEVNDTQYTTVQEAVNAAGDGATITMIDDSQETVTIAEDKNIILDLGEHTLSQTGDVNTIINNGTVTIKNGTITGDADGDCYTVLNNAGTMTIVEGVKVEGGRGAVYCNHAGSKLTITGGEFSAKQFHALYNHYGVVEISGGTFTDNFSGVCAETISNGVVEQVGTTTYEGPVSTTITGGYFSNDVSKVDHVTIPMGYRVIDAADKTGYCTIEKIKQMVQVWSTQVEANFDDEHNKGQYASLAEAFDAVKSSGYTVQLLANVDVNEALSLPNITEDYPNFKLDLNGFTINGNSALAVADWMNLIIDGEGGSIYPSINKTGNGALELLGGTYYGDITAGEGLIYLYGTGILAGKVAEDSITKYTSGGGVGWKFAKNVGYTIDNLADYYQESTLPKCSVTQDSAYVMLGSSAYTVVLHLNGGTIDENKYDTTVGTYDAEDDTFTIAVIYDSTASLAVPRVNGTSDVQFTREHYKFDGWYSGADTVTANKVVSASSKSLSHTAIPQYADENYEVHLYAKWTMIQCAQVTSTDGTSTFYPTLEKAIEAAKDGDTVKLLLTTTLTDTLTIDKDITLDLYIRSLTGPAAGVIKVTDGAQVNITTSTTSTSFTPTIQNTAGETGAVIVVEDGGVVIDDAENTVHVTIKDQTTSGAAVSVGAGGSVTINDGASISGNSALAIADGADTLVTITGGTFTVSGDTTLTGATVGNTKISGGTFNKDDVASYLLPGYELTGDGPYTVSEKSGMAAQVLDAGGNAVGSYDTLQAAVDAVPNGGTIVLLADGSAAVTAEKSFTVRSEEGANYTAAITAGSGYQLGTPTTNDDGSTTYTVTKTSSSGNGGSSGNGSSGSSSSSSGYTVSITKPSNGTVTASDRSPDRNDTVTLTVKPNAGYELDTLTVTDSKGNRVRLTDKGNGKYTFTMPASKVTVSATFAKIEEADGFVDVPANAYYHDAVAWAVENGITNGSTAATFDPDRPCTRAQTVTFLWRAAGCPEPVSKANPFTDVAADAYYYKAVLWAVENEITNGITATTFGPDRTVTRAQSITFLWRASGRIAAVNGAPFTDVAADAYYVTAVAWAVENGITNGATATTFGPNAPCTRAQIVTFLYRAFAE